MSFPGATDAEIPFPTEVANVGTVVTPDGTSSAFTLGTAGLYRIEFILQGGLNNADGAVVRINGINTEPMFTVNGFTSLNNQIVGAVVVEAIPGDVVEIVLVTPNGSNIQAGTSLIITQLSST